MAEAVEITNSSINTEEKFVRDYVAGVFRVCEHVYGVNPLLERLESMGIERKTGRQAIEQMAAEGLLLLGTFTSIRDEGIRPKPMKASKPSSQTPAASGHRT